ncbi:DUF547 domain-containing protein [Flavobacteriaceae bacterium R38]|nr:DUF547 domain-containing protein [Flavobacteriaceae bacterium R38]
MSCTAGKRSIEKNNKTIALNNTPAPVEEPQVVKEEEIEVKKTETIVPVKEVKSSEKEIEEKIEEKEKEVTEPIKTKIEVSKKVPEAFNHISWDELLQKHVSDNGKVDYKGFKRDRAALKAYLDQLAANLPQDSWTHKDKLAYWINVYNAYTVKLIIDNYPTTSIKDIKDPWGQRFFKLGEKWYNLNDVEHRILRKMGDPRIHFAIVCASISCPKLENRAFSAFNIEERLTKATKGFLSDPSKNNITKDRLKISKIFKWFTKDFKQNGSLVAFLNMYTDINIDKNAKISYNDYDWNLNE